MHDLHSLIGTIVIGILVGWLASVLVEGKGLGILGDMVVGILGAFIGNFLSNTLNIHIGSGLIGNLAISLLGAVVLLILIRLIKPAR
jgi:uncharacterized membrane protein YeaQ/YmgE (transglycosylase-associated protein family)